ncbi:MAG: glycogen/starch synthase [Bacteroidaceae bacterium]|nr:glycogen/starch synthase [Bacteroidaceae bacterium]
MQQPKYIIEASWEVCNKVGGIYTVLSTRAKTLHDQIGDKLLFIGPDFWIERENPLFKENRRLLSAWRKQAEAEGLKIRVGRWQIPGEPIAVLVDFTPFYSEKNNIYAWAWNAYQVDSLHAYGDYDEASMFAYAAAKVTESYYRHFGLTAADNVIYQAHEWMTCLGALYLQQHVPEIATIFTTHATSIGRSIAGNNKPLYDYLWAYNGDQMAAELNMQSKHSIEKQTAAHVDCFTTVSDITATECRELLDKPVDAVLTNGFEDDFVPKAGRPFNDARRKARKAMLKVANALMGTNLGDDTIIISTGGRYEFKNKGIDMLIESLNRLRLDNHLQRDVLAFINVPAWVKCPRIDLQKRLEGKQTFNTPIGDPRITHELHNQDQDKVLSQMNWLDIQNRADEHVKLIFVPCYLDGADGIFNMHYYDLLIGGDLAIYPSYYEPWGYTPTESIAFHVPCITTDLAGFGLWVNSLHGRYSTLADGVKTVHRTDNNFVEAAEEIKDTIMQFAEMTPAQVTQIRRQAALTAHKALWQYFIENYYKAYDIALTKRNKRINSISK